MTKNIKNFLVANEDPFKLPKLIKKARTDTFDLKFLENPQELRNLDLNALLFCTGYFSIKSESKEGHGKVVLDWTNDETRRAFYENYLREWGIDKNCFKEFLSQSISIQDGSLEQEKELLRQLIYKNMEKYFRKMLSFHYDFGEERDHEHNHAHNLFLNTLDSLLIDYDRWLRWKLVDENVKGKTTGKENLRKGGEPDFIVVTKDLPKQIIVFEIFKMGQAKR